MMIAAVVMLIVAGCGGGDTSARTEASLDEMWSTYSTPERDGLCTELELVGVDEVVDVFMADAPDMDRTTVRRWWLDTCS